MPGAGRWRGGEGMPGIVLRPFGRMSDLILRIVVVVEDCGLHFFLLLLLDVIFLSSPLRHKLSDSFP